MPVPRTDGLATLIIAFANTTLFVTKGFILVVVVCAITWTKAEVAKYRPPPDGFHRHMDGTVRPLETGLSR
ncbi:MAG: hypothetical protein Q7L55_07995 [Actinomycetota bacterium]|nr:hypothetical protein [Actinomycetota bacterium]